MQYNYVSLYDEEKFKLSLLQILSLFRWGEYKQSECIMFIIKNIITLHDFQIQNKFLIKLLLVYYFFIEWKVKFTNDYSIRFSSKFLPKWLTWFEKYIREHVKEDFQSFLILWKNTIFLNKIRDITLKESNIEYVERVKDVDNFIDFFLKIVHENSELYSFSWEHFPLLKWLINELCEE